MLNALVERMGHEFPRELEDDDHIIRDVSPPKLEDKMVTAVIVKSIEEDEEFAWERLEEEDEREDEDDDRFRGQAEVKYLKVEPEEGEALEKLKYVTKQF